MRQLNLTEMIDNWNHTLGFRKTGKNEYTVINKQGTDVGITTGQSRYFYLKCFNLLKYHK